MKDEYGRTEECNEGKSRLIENRKIGVLKMGNRFVDEMFKRNK